MKNILIITSWIILLSACSKTDKKAGVSIVNHTSGNLELEIFDPWSGHTDTVIQLTPGNTTWKTDTLQTVGCYTPGYPEITFFTHENAKLHYRKQKIQTDTLNQIVQRHQQWTQTTATGQAQKIFRWPDFTYKHSAIKSWQSFDTILYKLFAQKPVHFNLHEHQTHHLYSYPAAYMLLHQYCDTTGLWIKNHVKHIADKLKKAGIPQKTAKAFMLHYFQPQKVNLRNDSVLMVLNRLHPSISSDLKEVYQQLQDNAPIKKGDTLIPITGLNPAGTSIKLQFTTPRTIIDFWATWCVPCVKQLPDLNQYAREMQNQVRFVSISLDNAKYHQKWYELAQKTPAIQHIWAGDTTELRNNLGIKGLPRMILVNQKGVIIDPDFPHLSNALSHKWLKKLPNTQNHLP